MADYKHEVINQNNTIYGAVPILTSHVYVFLDDTPSSTILCMFS